MLGWLKKKTIKQEATTDLLQELLSTSTDSLSGAVVNTKTAQGLPAVYCAVNTISEAIASMPLHVFKKNDQGEKERQRNSAIERLLNVSPNGYQSAFDFKVALMRSALLTGNGYAEIVYDKSGRLQRLIPLHPNEVSIKELPDYRLGYKITKDGKYRSLTQDEVLHIRVNSDDGILGKSPITVCRESIGTEIASLEHGASTFKNGCNPGGVLTYPDRIDPEVAKRTIDYFAKRHSGAKNAQKPAVITQGGKWERISMSNQDSQWLESKQFGVAEIARMFKISPIFLQDYSNSTYSNFAEASKAFLQQTLKPWLTNIESALLMSLVPERNQMIISVEFETKDILRTTAKERFEIYDIAIRNGLMSPNECRRAENLSTREGGDEYSQSWQQNTDKTVTEGALVL